MTTITHTDSGNRLRVVFDDERTAIVERYAILFEGRDTVVIAQPGELPSVVWQRVLDTVADIRSNIRRGEWRGRFFYFATVYAGILPTEQQKQEHLKSWVSFCLYQLAEPAYNKDAASQVEALIALSDLHGLNAPRRLNLPDNLREMVAEEQARRRAAA